MKHKQKNKKSGDYATTVQSIIDADKDNRIKKYDFWKKCTDDERDFYIRSAR